MGKETLEKSSNAQRQPEALNSKSDRCLKCCDAHIEMVSANLSCLHRVHLQRTLQRSADAHTSCEIAQAPGEV